MEPRTELNRDNDAAAQYAQSIERERMARQEMQSYAPGSLERALAWKEWSEAIVRTNHAWRRLRANNVGRSRPIAVQSERPPSPERPTSHAGA